MPGVRRQDFFSTQATNFTTMEIELLRFVNGAFVIAGPILLIGPLIRKGRLLWLWLPLIFTACLASHFYVYQEKFPWDSALLRAGIVSTVVMAFGWAMAVTMRKYEANEAKQARDSTTPLQSHGKAND